MKKTRKAFTLIEMVIVLFIISLLLLIMIPNLAAQRDHANQRSQEAFITTIKTQKELYAENNPDKVSDKDVTLEELEKDKYITTKQKQRAEKIEKTKLEVKDES